MSCSLIDRAAIAWAVVSLFLVCASSSASGSEGDYIRLVAALDEPEFYCLDITGWGVQLKLDDPLQTHTCKTRNADDQMFRFADGRIEVTEFDRCLEVAGSGHAVLKGSAVIARPCTDSPPQQVTLGGNGRIQIGESSLCLGAGEDSAEAFGPSHMWRTLAAVECDSTNNEFITWQIGLVDELEGEKK